MNKISLIFFIIFISNISFGLFAQNLEESQLEKSEEIDSISIVQDEDSRLPFNEIWGYVILGELLKPLPENSVVTRNLYFKTEIRKC